MNKPFKLVRNTETGEVYEPVPPSQWTEKLTAWREAMRNVEHVRDCPIPSPIPSGHIMFLRSPKRRPSLYQPVE